MKKKLPKSLEELVKKISLADAMLAVMDYRSKRYTLKEILRIYQKITE